MVVVLLNRLNNWPVQQMFFYDQSSSLYVSKSITAWACLLKIAVSQVAQNLNNHTLL
jgi:hypothetical protein